MLQAMSETYPWLCLNDLERPAELLKSYQNRSNVGAALLWALGQGGRQEMALGIKGRNDNRSKGTERLNCLHGGRWNGRQELVLGIKGRATESIVTYYLLTSFMVAI